MQSGRGFVLSEATDMATASQTWTTPGVYSWPAPTGLTHLDDTQAQGGGGGGGQGAGSISQQVTTYFCTGTDTFQGTHVGGNRYTSDRCWQSCDNWQQTGSQFFFATFNRSPMVNDLTGATINKVELYANNQTAYYSGAYLRIGYGTRQNVKTDQHITDINTGGFPTQINKVFWSKGENVFHTVDSQLIQWFLDPKYKDNQGNWANSLLFGDDDTQNLNDFGSWASGANAFRIRVTYTQNTITGGGGGGGGGFARKSGVLITGGSSYTVVVGAGGSGGILGDSSPEDGVPSYFAGDSQVVQGGAGTAGTQGTASGSGDKGLGGAPVGTPGSDYDTITSGDGEDGEGGGAAHGGFGGDSPLASGGAQQNSTADGFDGSFPGAGGGGARGANDGGNGRDGKVFIQWTIPNLTISDGDSAQGASDSGGISHASQASPDTAGVSPSTGEHVVNIKLRDG